MRIISGVALAVCSLLTGCLFLDGSYHANRITALSVGLGSSSWEYDGTEFYGVVSQRNRTIVVEVPHWVDRSQMKVLYESKAARITVDGRELVWDRTKLDLRTPRVLRVHAVDGTSTEYTLSTMLHPVGILGLEASSSLVLVSPGQWVLTLPQDSPATRTLVVQAWAAAVMVDEGAPVPLARTHNSQDYSEGSFEVPAGGVHTLTLVGSDGSTATETITCVWETPTITAAVLKAKANAALANDVEATIDRTSQKVTFSLLEGTAVSALTPTLTFEGTQLKLGDEDLEKAGALDLTTPATVTLVGRDGSSSDWTLEVEFHPPRSEKDLSSLTLYTLDDLPPPFLPGSKNQLLGSDRDSSLGVIDWSPNSRASWSVKSLYLEVVTTGARVTAQGRTLTQGSLPDRFSQDNWLDLTNPVDLTIEAEDGSTRVFTLKVRKP